MSKRNNSNKRVDSTIEYIDDLSDEFSKLNIVRVDLSYKKPYSDTMSLEDVNKDLDRMANNMRSKPTIFKHKIGHVLKREYTEDKGVHLHAMFIFNGQKIISDTYKADEIGKYWEKTTADKGTYHNCNRNNYDKKGIGMLDYKDSEKRKILDEIVIPYMCKDDQDIGVLKGDKRSKAFTRGIVTKKKSSKGRPRDK